MCPKKQSFPVFRNVKTLESVTKKVITSGRCSVGIIRQDQQDLQSNLAIEFWNGL